MERMKQCFKCGIVKQLEDFYRHPDMPDGHVNKCKECNKRDVRANYSDKKDAYKAYDKNRQRHSKTRIFNHRYTQIKQRVEGRATREYKVKGTEMLTYEQYCVWVKNNMDEFDKIYLAWQQGGFVRRLTPSIDRIDNKQGYTADNIQWLPLYVNNEKYVN